MIISCMHIYPQTQRVVYIKYIPLFVYQAYLKIVKIIKHSHLRLLSLDFYFLLFAIKRKLLATHTGRTPRQAPAVTASSLRWLILPHAVVRVKEILAVSKDEGDIAPGHKE